MQAHAHRRLQRQIIAVIVTLTVGAMLSCSSNSISDDDDDSSGSSDCYSVCDKARECGLAPSNCTSECSEAMGQARRVLQAPALAEYDACMSSVVDDLAQIACDDFESRLDCFGNAVTIPGCEDPGWAAFADSACNEASCSSEQQATCVENVLSTQESVPCLNAAGLREAVSCEVTCSANSVSLVCSYPG